MVNTIYLLSFVETPRKFIIAKLSIRKLGSSSVLYEDPSLRIESFAIINLRGVSTKLNNASKKFVKQGFCIVTKIALTTEQVSVKGCRDLD